MTIRRISFDIEEEEHKNLKSYCAQLGMTIRELVIRAINDKVQKKMFTMLGCRTLKKLDVVFLKNFLWVRCGKMLLSRVT